MVAGRVQGVGFRAFVRRSALGERLTGYARNLPDGRVEVVAQGSAENLRRLIAIVRVGPRLAHVQAVEETWQQPQRIYTGFYTR